MSLTDEQAARAQAWTAVFADGPATTAVLDDMTVFVNALPESQQAGAAKLLLYILLRRSLLRREKTRSRKETSRG